MACPGGCVAGAGTITPVMNAASNVRTYKAKAAKQNSLDSDYVTASRRLKSKNVSSKQCCPLDSPHGHGHSAHHCSAAPWPCLPAGAAIAGPFGVNQLVTGSLVNCVLFVFTALSGLWSGVTMGIVSAMLAQFIGIGPAVSAVSPVVAVGNALLCVVYGLIIAKAGSEGVRQWIAMAIAAVFKCAFLWIAVPFCSACSPASRSSSADAQHNVLLAPGLHRPHRGTLASLVIPRLRKAR